jgi:hypothetical protein
LKPYTVGQKAPQLPTFIIEAKLQLSKNKKKKRELKKLYSREELKKPQTLNKELNEGKLSRLRA